MVTLHMATIANTSHDSIQALGYTHPKAGQKWSTGSPVIGYNSNNPKFYVRTATGPASGTIYFRAWDSSGSVLHTYGEYDATNLTSSFQLIEPSSSSIYATGLADGDIVGCEFTGSSSHYFHIAFSSTNQVNDSTYMDYKTSSSSWVDQSPADLGFSLDYNVSPTPTTEENFFPPPPAMVRL